MDSKSWHIHPHNRILLGKGEKEKKIVCTQFFLYKILDGGGGGGHGQRQLNCYLGVGLKEIRKGMQKSSEESFGDDRNVLYLGCGDGFTSL